MNRAGSIIRVIRIARHSRRTIESLFTPCEGCRRARNFSTIIKWFRRTGGRRRWRRSLAVSAERRIAGGRCWSRRGGANAERRKKGGAGCPTPFVELKRRRRKRRAVGRQPLIWFRTRPGGAIKTEEFVALLTGEAERFQGRLVDGGGRWKALRGLIRRHGLLGERAD